LPTNQEMATIENKRKEQIIIERFNTYYGFYFDSMVGKKHECSSVGGRFPQRLYSSVGTSPIHIAMFIEADMKVCLNKQHNMNGNAVLTCLMVLIIIEKQTKVQPLLNTEHSHYCVQHLNNKFLTIVVNNHSDEIVVPF